MQPKVWLVVGTRPEAIKLAPLAAALAERAIEPLVVATGQHPALALGDHGFECRVETLCCPGLPDPLRHARSVTAALLPLLKAPPWLLVVQGDTSSAFGAAFAAHIAAVPVAHVEAGLRTHDPAMPWPEEEFRTAIDAGAELLFAPTELAAANLRREQVPGAIRVTGNTGIDALLAKLPHVPARSMHDRGTPQILVTCHRRENWGAPLEAIAGAVRRIAEQGVAAVQWLLPPNRHVAGEMHTLLGARANVTLHEPCSHEQLIAMMLDCDLMLSDSGGVQEEAAALGVPLLVLRDKTERPEAIATGNMRLIGTEPRRILAEVTTLLANPVDRAAMSIPAFPYGDGRASPRIAAAIADWLERTQGRDQGRAGMADVAPAA